MATPPNKGPTQKSMHSYFSLLDSVEKVRVVHVVHVVHAVRVRVSARVCVRVCEHCELV